MSRIIRLIDNETIEISDYRNSGYLFGHNAPTIEDIRKQISNIDDWCIFKETINPFVLYGEKEELQQRIDKALKLCNRYIANEKINRYPDYYYLSMFEEIKKELTKGSEE